MNQRPCLEEGAKQLPVECNIKPLEEAFQCIHKHKFMGTKGSSAVSSRKEMQGTTPAWHFSNRGVTWCHSCTNSEPHNDENVPEPGSCLVLPGLGWAPQVTPPSSHAEHPRVCFVFNSVFLLPFPLRHLITERHKWAGVSTARVLLQEHNPAASSCCFPEQLTTSRRLWNKMKDPGYFLECKI